jgi:uncharacterized protein YijF (DUF1287 family)
MSADQTFGLVIHLGDIKAGAGACTDAYIRALPRGRRRHADAQKVHHDMASTVRRFPSVARVPSTVITIS